MAHTYTLSLIDRCALEESLEYEFDNSCHFTNIQAYWLGSVLWNNTEQIVYTPIFGTNIENDPNGPARYVAVWEATKQIVFIRHHVSAEIWAAYKALTDKVFYEIILPPAKCNLVTYWRFRHVFTPFPTPVEFIPLTPVEAPVVEYNTDLDEVDVDTYDLLWTRENLLLSSDNRIKDYALTSFIDAVKLRGWRDENGNCPYTDPYVGDLAYLCDNRGFDLDISTIHGSYRERLHTNINTMYLDKSKKLRTNFESVYFGDEWTNILTNVTRKLIKYPTNIATWKPLKYVVKTAPAEYTSVPIENITPVVIRGNNNTFTVIELPVSIASQDTESIFFELVYSYKNIAPPASVSMTIVPENTESRTVWSKIALTLRFYRSYKLPLCILSTGDPSYDLPIVLDREYPIDTFGWGMKDRFKILIPKITSTNVLNTISNGNYRYRIDLKAEIPSVFNDCAFGDFYGNISYVSSLPLQLNIRK